MYSVVYICTYFLTPFHMIIGYLDFYYSLDLRTYFKGLTPHEKPHIKTPQKKTPQSYLLTRKMLTPKKGHTKNYPQRKMRTLDLLHVSTFLKVKYNN